MKTTRYFRCSEWVAGKTTLAPTRPAIRPASGRPSASRGRINCGSASCSMLCASSPTLRAEANRPKAASASSRWCATRAAKATSMRGLCTCGRCHKARSSPAYAPSPAGSNTAAGSQRHVKVPVNHTTVGSTGGSGVHRRPTLPDAARRRPPGDGAFLGLRRSINAGWRMPVPSFCGRAGSIAFLELAFRIRCAHHCQEPSP